MAIDHFGIPVAQDKWEATKAFYEQALAPLGYKVLSTFMDGDVIGMGTQYPDFWISKASGDRNPGDGTHFAFAATTREQVQAFHSAGLANGGKCNGPPGLRAEYTPTYFATFVHDPSGNNVEVVTHSSE